MFTLAGLPSIALATDFAYSATRVGASPHPARTPTSIRYSARHLMHYVVRKRWTLVCKNADTSCIRAGQMGQLKGYGIVCSHQGTKSTRNTNSTRNSKFFLERCKTPGT